MALSIKISASEVNDALSFNVTDKTVYGGSNPAVGDILTANLSITPPNYTVPIVVNIPLVQFVLMATTPFNVTAATLGLSTLPDGIYTISMTVTYAAAPTTSTGTTTVGFVAVIDCCVKKKLAAVSIEESCGCCDSNVADQAMEAWTDLCIARASMQFGLTNVFNKFLKRVQKLCDPLKSGCGCP